MATERTEQPSQPTQERNPIQDTLRKVLLAGIGAMALAQDEFEALVNRLVERGELAEKDGKKLIREMMEKQKKENRRVEEYVTKRVEETLSRLNMPTKGDIEALSKKISALSKKIDDLKKPQSQ